MDEDDIIFQILSKKEENLEIKNEAEILNEILGDKDDKEVKDIEKDKTVFLNIEKEKEEEKNEEI